jgi:hypothetical protein
MENKEKSILEIILPEGTFEWFDVLEGHKDEENIYIVLQEKNIPPLTEKDKNKKVTAADFKEITITDFPIRGRRTLLTFKRRYWKIEGEKEFLKRDIQLQFPGTQLVPIFIGIKRRWRKRNPARWLLSQGLKGSRRKNLKNNTKII